MKRKKQSAFVEKGNNLLHLNLIEQWSIPPSFTKLIICFMTHDVLTWSSPMVDFEDFKELWDLQDEVSILESFNMIKVKYILQATSTVQATFQIISCSSFFHLCFDKIIYNFVLPSI